MNDAKVTLPLKRFLLMEQCPEAWKSLDLYVFRDEAVVFYVGQSYLAFARVWEHLLSGFKGHSIMGRFVWVNWPKSMKFTLVRAWPFGLNDGETAVAIPTTCKKTPGFFAILV